MNIIMHGHHAGTLFSFLPSLEERLREIDEVKPLEERALRKALAQDVSELLPHTEARAALDQARAVLDQARAAFAQAWAALDQARAALAQAWATLDQAWATLDQAWPARAQAWAAFDQARAAYLASFDVEAFHREHCHPRCPWDGKSIFAKGTSVKVLDV